MDEKLDEALKGTFPATDPFDLGHEDGSTYASPPCFMHELDPGYLGYLSTSETIALLNQLLEAEHADARAVAEMGREGAGVPDPATFRGIAEDEAGFCAMLTSHITRIGGTPRPQTGAIYGKPIASDSYCERVDLLDRGQALVVRKLREALPRIGDSALHRDLKNMLDVHERNIQRCKEAEMSTRAAGIPRYRPFAGPALLREGFRPFFLGAALWSALALCLWLGQLTGHLVLPSALDPLTWHAHEMIFGFAAAAVGGFLLTAIPNWTGRMPLQGMPLAALVLAWLAGRIALAFSALIGALPAAAIDVSFLLLLLLAVTREIAAGGNWRNLPMPVALALLMAANLLVHMEAIGAAPTAALGLRLGIAVLLMLVALVPLHSDYDSLVGFG